MNEQTLLAQCLWISYKDSASWTSQGNVNSCQLHSLHYCHYRHRHHLHHHQLWQHHFISSNSYVPEAVLGVCVCVCVCVCVY